MDPQTSVREETQVYFTGGVWRWRHVNLLTSAILETSVPSFATPQLARAAALLAHPTLRAEYFWVSEGGVADDGTSWKRYQDA